MNRIRLLSMAAALALAPAPAAADWFVLHEVESGRIQMVALMTPNEIATQMQAPGPRPGLARLHYKGAELPSPWRCRVTPQKTIVCDEGIAIAVAPGVSVTQTTTTTVQATRPGRPADSGKDIRVPVPPRPRQGANREVGWSDRMYIHDRPITPRHAPDPAIDVPGDERSAAEQRTVIEEMTIPDGPPPVPPLSDSY